MRSKGETEAAVRTAIIKFEQEFLGRGPDEVRAFIVRDMLVVRLKGVLTPAEKQLAKTPKASIWSGGFVKTSLPRAANGSASR